MLTVHIRLWPRHAPSAGSYLCKYVLRPTSMIDSMCGKDFRDTFHHTGEMSPWRMKQTMIEIQPRVNCQSDLVALAFQDLLGDEAHSSNL